jgi:hypothetical protein
MRPSGDAALLHRTKIKTSRERELRMKLLTTLAAAGAVCLTLVPGDANAQRRGYYWVGGYAVPTTVYGTYAYRPYRYRAYRPRAYAVSPYAYGYYPATYAYGYYPAAYAYYPVSYGYSCGGWGWGC